MRKINHAQIHYSQTKNNWFTGDNHDEIMEALRRWHIGRGWFDMGYNRVVFPDGIVLAGRSIKRRPAGILNHNKGGIAWCLIGTFDACHPNKLQYNAVIKDVSEHMEKYNFTKLVFHRDFTNKKTCPGLMLDKEEMISLIEVATW